jgi:aconitate hydratase
MLAIGAGGIEVALAMAGEPFHFAMPLIWGVELVGELPPWVSAKDVILEMLRRHGVDGGVGRIIEYYGRGLACLSAMDRHVIANMGAELGATTTIFPSDGEVLRFLRSQGREQHWKEIMADPHASYDISERIDLSSLEPLIAMPSSPANVVPVRQVQGQEIYQSYVGSSANPGYRDFAVVAEIVKNRQIHERVSFDINPTSRQILENLIRDGHLLSLVRAGARIHQAGCNGCIGMGQAPATQKLSLRTVPRNFPGRSGTREDKVCLVSPETAAASALRGVITDPRSLGFAYPAIREPEHPILNEEMLSEPPSPKAARQVKLIKGPNISSIPDFDPLPQDLELSVLLKVGDEISTDTIMPAGARVLPFRSNIPKISQFVYESVDETYPRRASEAKRGHAIVAGRTYGQGSSREHAALAPRYLGLRVVIAKDFARIHRQNLIDFGILPLTLADASDYDVIASGDVLRFSRVPDQLRYGKQVVFENVSKSKAIHCDHGLSTRQVEVLLSGGLINWARHAVTEQRVHH